MSYPIPKFDKSVGPLNPRDIDIALDCQSLNSDRPDMLAGAMPTKAWTWIAEQQFEAGQVRRNGAIPQTMETIVSQLSRAAGPTLLVLAIVCLVKLVL